MPHAVPQQYFPGQARSDEDSLVDLRCSVVILHGDNVLLLHRAQLDEWVLPGGRPRAGESLVSCARREVREETGLYVDPGRCLFVLEVASPDRTTHIVELVFLAAHGLEANDLNDGEAGSEPRWVALSDLAGRRLRPPIAGHLRGMASGGDRRSAPYLGNVWRPNRHDPGPVRGA